MATTFTTQQIQWDSAAYHSACVLRDTEFRLPLGMQLSAEDVSAEKYQEHFAAFVDDVVVACVLFKPFSKKHLKLRQMAVARSQQGRGVGQRLVAFAEFKLRESGFQSVELAARCTAKGFYLKLGYSPEGAIFTEVGIPHVKMVKTLA